MYKYSDFIVQYKSIVNFINENEGKNIVEFAISAKKEFGNLSVKISDWQKCRLKASLKLPHFLKSGCIFTSRSYEQCTPELLSKQRFKNLKGKRALVIGGGLGVDDYFLSSKFDEVISLDPDEELNEIARYNFTLLGVNNINRISITAEEYLENNKEQFDYIFIDPDRRNEGARKSALEELKPDIIKLWPTLLKTTPKIEIKLSPLTDTLFLLNEFQYHIDITCSSIKNDIKELLITKSVTSNGNLKSVNITQSGEIFEFQSVWNNKLTIKIESELNSNLFIPYKTLYKIGIEDFYGTEHGLYKTDKSCLFYTSNETKKETKGGNWYKILLRPKSLSEVKQYVKSRKIKHLNISCLRSEFNEQEILKYTGVKEGGEQFVFIYGKRKNPIILIANKLITN